MLQDLVSSRLPREGSDKVRIALHLYRKHLVAYSCLSGHRIYGAVTWWDSCLGVNHNQGEINALKPRCETRDDLKIIQRSEVHAIYLQLSLFPESEPFEDGL